jgi:septal ring factor EnvC (AmiA/AmiB activator)
MTFFGNILLDEKLVTTQQLVEALVTQSEELASPIRICLDQKIVAPDRLVDAVLEAAEQHTTLPEMLHRMKLVDSQKAEQITQALKNQRRPIGQILVEQGVELKNLSQLLARHQKAQEQMPDASGFEFHFPEVHGETKKQYLNFFSPQFKEELERTINQLSQGGAHARQLEDMLHQLTAAAGFARMEVSRHLCERAALLMERLNMQQLNWAAQTISRDLISTLDVLWELQRFIEISGSERDFWQNAQSRQNYLKAFQALERHLPS